MSAPQKYTLNDRRKRSVDDDNDPFPHCCEIGFSVRGLTMELFFNVSPFVRDSVETKIVHDLQYATKNCDENRYRSISIHPSVH